MSADRQPSSKVRYAALFAGRRRTDIPYNIRGGNVQDTVDKSVQHLLLRHTRHNGKANDVERIADDGDEHFCKDSFSSAIRSMPRVTLTINRKRLKVKVAVDRKGRVQTDDMTSNGARRSTSSAVIKQATFRHRLHNLLLVARCSHPLLSNAVACVLSEGYDASTTGWIHMHVYWFVDGLPEVRGSESAELFLRHASHYIDTDEHRKLVRRVGVDMVARGRVRLLPVTTDAINNNVDLRRAATTTESGKRDVPVTAEIKSNTYDPTTSLAMSLVVDQHGRVRRSTSNTTQVSIVSTPVVDDSTRQVAVNFNRDISNEREAQFSADGLDLDDADCVALRKRIARLSLMTAGNYSENRPSSTPATVLPRPLSNTYEAFDQFQSPYGEQFSDAGVWRGGPAWNVPPPIASLSDELKTRLVSGAPILLPPKDYDTVNRHRGKPTGIEARRCYQENVFGGPAVVSSLF